MSYSNTQETQHKAIKKHSCDWCGTGIVIGEQYKRYRSFYDNEASTIKMHLECFDAMLKEASLEGEFFEWMPGEYERPCKEAA